MQDPDPLAPLLEGKVANMDSPYVGGVGCWMLELGKAPVTYDEIVHPSHNEGVSFMSK